MWKMHILWIILVTSIGITQGENNETIKIIKHVELDRDIFSLKKKRSVTSLHFYAKDKEGDASLLSSNTFYYKLHI